MGWEQIQEDRLWRRDKREQPWSFSPLPFRIVPYGVGNTHWRKTMTEQRNALTDLIAACWKDDALKARFMADPKAVLAERGIEMPDGIDVNVVENADNTVHITLPMAPDGHEDLSLEELSKVAGGLGPLPPGGLFAADTWSGGPLPDVMEQY